MVHHKIMLMVCHVIHGRESLDLNWWNFQENQGKFYTTIGVGISLIYSLILVRFAWGLKPETSEKYRNLPVLSDFQTKY